MNTGSACVRLICRIVLVGAAISFAGCSGVPAEQRMDNWPMYGQPNIPRPEEFKSFDEAFIKQATEIFGSRENASKAWFHVGERFTNEGNLDYAMRRYNQSWLLNPGNYQPFWGFGRVLVARKKFDEAIEHLEKAKLLCESDPYQKVALEVDLATAYSLKADSIPKEQVKERAHYFDLANQNYKESIAEDSAFPHSWRQWAKSLFREEMYSDSWEKVKKARSLNAPAFPKAFLHELESKIPEPK